MSSLNFIELELPLPISVNCAYSNVGKKRIKSQKYNDWLEIAHLAYNKYAHYYITGDSWLSVEYTLYMPIYTSEGKKKMIDSFNFEKTCSDFLVKRLKGFKDEKIIEGRIIKINSDKNTVRVKIWECDEFL